MNQTTVRGLLGRCSTDGSGFTPGKNFEYVTLAFLGETYNDEKVAKEIREYLFRKFQVGSGLVPLYLKCVEKIKVGPKWCDLDAMELQFMDEEPMKNAIFLNKKWGQLQDSQEEKPGYHCTMKVDADFCRVGDVLKIVSIDIEPFKPGCKSDPIIRFPVNNETISKMKLCVKTNEAKVIAHMQKFVNETAAIIVFHRDNTCKGMFLEEWEFSNDENQGRPRYDHFIVYGPDEETTFYPTVDFREEFLSRLTVEPIGAITDAHDSSHRTLYRILMVDNLMPPICDIPEMLVSSYDCNKDNEKKTPAVPKERISAIKYQSDLVYPDGHWAVDTSPVAEIAKFKVYHKERCMEMTWKMDSDKRGFCGTLYVSDTKTNNRSTFNRDSTLEERVSFGIISGLCQQVYADLGLYPQYQISGDTSMTAVDDVLHVGTQTEPNMLHAHTYCTGNIGAQYDGLTLQGPNPGGPLNLKNGKMSSAMEARATVFRKRLNQVWNKNKDYLMALRISCMIKD